MYEWFVSLDTWVLQRAFTPVAHAFERTTGRSNFFLAECTLWLAFGMLAITPIVMLAPDFSAALFCVAIDAYMLPAFWRHIRAVREFDRWVQDDPSSQITLETNLVPFMRVTNELVWTMAFVGLSAMGSPFCLMAGSAALLFAATYLIFVERPPPREEGEGVQMRFSFAF